MTISINNAMTPIVADLRYLKLDQTTVQTVINGKPIFDKGLKSDDDLEIKAGKKLILDG